MIVPAAGGEAALHIAAGRLGRVALAPLVDELARRFGAGSMPARIGLRGIDDGAREAIADLLGLARFEVTRLMEALGLQQPGQLRAVVERLRGPVGDRAADRAAARRQRDGLWAWFEERCAVVEVAGLGPLRAWPAQVRREGVRGAVDRYRARLGQVLDVLDALARVPEGGVPLASLANGVLGDSHGLDPGQPVARLVVAALADAAGEARPETAEAVRGLWERVRVSPDPLSSNVLALGLAGESRHPMAALLDRHRAAAEPLVLTLSQLQRWPLGPLSAGAAFVVENPAVVAVAASRAAHRGWDGPPLVCSSGRPSIAVVTLLRQLGAGGAPLYQHADFDPGGLGITGWLSRHAGTIPWLMTAERYLEAVSVPRERPPIERAVPATAWDPDLAPAMGRHGCAVFEEELADGLLQICDGSMRCERNFTG